MKLRNIVIAIAIILVILILSISIVYIIDMNRMENNKPVIFSTWGYRYAPPEIERPIDNVQEDKDSFVGTILEETTSYMIIEPNEDEEERKSSDKIIISYGTDNVDHLYGVGRKVVIFYDGIILETYPAKIKSNKISTTGYSDFDILVEKSEQTIAKKILSNSELNNDGQDFDLYYYGLESVNVRVDNKEMKLEDALRSGKLTLYGIIAKATMDITNPVEYKDGGSTEFHYEDYTIIKVCNMKGNRDVYIGSPDMNLNDLEI